jgi:hypothetical protein
MQAGSGPLTLEQAASSAACRCSVNRCQLPASSCYFFGAAAAGAFFSAFGCFATINPLILS